MPVVDERVNAIQGFDLFVSVTKRGSLNRFPLRAAPCMEALLAEDQMARSAVKEQFWPLQVSSSVFRL